VEINKTTDLPTAVCKNWGFGLDFTHCFVLLWSVIYSKFGLTKSPTSASPTLALIEKK